MPLAAPVGTPVLDNRGQPRPMRWYSRHLFMENDNPMLAKKECNRCGRRPWAHVGYEGPVPSARRRTSDGSIGGSAMSDGPIRSKEKPGKSDIPAQTGPVSSSGLSRRPGDSSSSMQTRPVNSSEQGKGTAEEVLDGLAAFTGHDRPAPRIGKL